MRRERWERIAVALALACVVGWCIALKGRVEKLEKRAGWFMPERSER